MSGIKKNKLQFKKVCKCIMHENVPRRDEITFNLINLKKGKKLNQRTYENLIEEGWLTRRSTFICTYCIRYFLDRKSVKENEGVACVSLEKDEDTVMSEESSAESEGMEEYVQPKDMLSQVKNEMEINVEFRQKMIGLIAQELNVSLDQEINQEEKMKQDDVKEVLMTCSVEDSFNSMPDDIKAFFAALCNNTDGKRKYAIVKILEYMKFIRDTRYWGPISTRESVCNYLVSGSKFSVALSSSTSPAASYSTTLQILKEIANDSSANYPPFGNVVIAIDNNQVLGKTYSLFNNRTGQPLSKVCSVMSLLVSPQLGIQGEVLQKVEISQIDFTEYFDHCNSIFRGVREFFIESEIKAILKDFSTGDSLFMDKQYSKIVPNCNPPKLLLSLLEPFKEDPASHASVKYAISEVLRRSSVSTEEAATRKNITMVMDGRPFVLLLDLLEKEEDLQDKLLLKPGKLAYYILKYYLPVKILDNVF